MQRDRSQETPHQHVAVLLFELDLCFTLYSPKAETFLLEH